MPKHLSASPVKNLPTEVFIGNALLVTQALNLLSKCKHKVTALELRKKFADNNKWWLWLVNSLIHRWPWIKIINTWSISCYIHLDLRWLSSLSKVAGIYVYCKRSAVFCCRLIDTGAPCSFFLEMARTFKCLWGPEIDSKEWIPPAYSSLAGRYENPIPPRCLAPIDFLKIPAQGSC